MKANHEMEAHVEKQELYAIEQMEQYICSLRPFIKLATTNLNELVKFSIYTNIKQSAQKSRLF